MGSVHTQNCWKGDFQHGVLNQARCEHLQGCGDEVYCMGDRTAKSKGK